jgi:ribosomal-protein-alanine N-acetyltransferase
MVESEIDPQICAPAARQIVIRKGTTADHRAAEAIQLAAFGHVHWPFRDDLFLVAELDGEMAAYMVWRQTAYPDEFEILSFATHPRHQRKGLARRLMEAFRRERRGDCFLEVRESSAGARAFYQTMGFEETGTRHAYYKNNSEGAIVMKLRM